MAERIGRQMDINAEDDFFRTLRQALEAKAPVEVQTRGGQSLKGPVRAVGKAFAVVGPLSGRDFFDAHVRVADISAICVQVRGR